MGFSGFDFGCFSCVVLCSLWVCCFSGLFDFGLCSLDLRLGGLLPVVCFFCWIFGFGFNFLGFSVSDTYFSGLAAFHGF